MASFSQPLHRPSLTQGHGHVLALGTVAMWLSGVAHHLPGSLGCPFPG